MGYLSSQDWFPWLIVSEESNDFEISCIFFWCVLGGVGAWELLLCLLYSVSVVLVVNDGAQIL